jgi:hypothetical protein
LESLDIIAGTILGQWVHSCSQQPPQIWSMLRDKRRSFSLAVLRLAVTPLQRKAKTAMPRLLWLWLVRQAVGYCTKPYNHQGQLSHELIKATAQFWHV